ncbi:hypothetical protein LCGC14_1632110 [marine sediment metagenome]|uniref:Uncharacterized protein n=1 Tax=marine sediment metagenome TaxID=412755 RepID=A0A0F9KHX4_9ZZZZ
MLTTPACIDEECAALLPALSADAEGALKESISERGWRDALVVWKQEGILLDGHNRMRICDANWKDYKYKYSAVSLPDRDASFATAVDTLAGNLGTEAKTALLSGDTNLSRKDVQAAAELPKGKQKAAVAKLLKGDGKGNLKAHQNQGVIEWYTPEKYVDPARKVMGGIDLDPASNPLANKTVKAKKFFAARDNGLSKPWKGTVILNPPFRADLISQFVAKLCRHHAAGDVTQAVLLTNNNTDTRWCHEAAAASAAICFTAGRIPFYNPDKEVAAPTNGHTLFYFGDQLTSFVSEFSELGTVMVQAAFMFQNGSSRPHR